MGQPPGHAARTCLLAVALADRLGVPPGQRTDVFLVGLLRYLGCTADASELAAFAGDEIALAVAVAPFAMGPIGSDTGAGPSDGEPPAVQEAKAAAITAHCEAAALLAGRLGLGEEVVRALEHAFERWDGAGLPAGLAGDAIPLATRIAIVARDVDVWFRLGGHAAVRAAMTERLGRAYDPAVAQAVLDSEPALVDDLPEDPWDALLAVEPGPVRVSAARLTTLLEVVADFTDAKLPYALGHSRDVARIARAAAGELGLGEAAGERLARAALVADLGRCGITNQVWDRPASLGTEEVERIRLHPYLSERILARPQLLRPLARLAASHHERLDGSGYHRGSTAPALGMEERVLAAAHGWCAMLQDRPYRAALTPGEAGRELADEVGAGRLDRRAVAAVTAAAGQLPSRLPRQWPDGLTDREVEVLRLACRGASRQEVATRLSISAKTVSRHLENGYAKARVSTRAAAALYAVEHGLLAEGA
jgi:HD-GYP domain-containing protein (c-di-GMP phosphodiesterase class II)